MFYKKAGLKTFALITPVLEPLFNSAAGLHEGDLQACNFVEKIFFCYQCQIFKTIIYSSGHETIYFEKYLRTAASENLSHAAILIFRRYFRSNSLPAFYKVSVLKASVKFLEKHTCWILFAINLQTLSLKFYQMKDCITNIFQ